MDKKTKKKYKKIKLPMSLAKKVFLAILGIVVVSVAAYLLYYFFHYTRYNKYRNYLSSYEYETGSVFNPIPENSADVAGMQLAAENDYLKLYTDLKTANIAVYDKRDGSITYSNPLNADEDSMANASNLNALKSQFIVTYYNQDVKSGTYDSYSQCVAKNQFTAESIEGGIRYLYKIGNEKDNNGQEGIHFDIPLEYRLKDDSLEVSIPVSGIKEYGNGSIARIQLLRYMGAAHNDEEGYLVVPNGSGSLIYFNNGKTTAASYSQYIYDIDPVAASYTTTENITGVKLPLFGICRPDRSLLVTVEDGASTALITAGISGVYNDYNYAFPTFVLRNIDNLRNFGNTTQDVYVLEQDIYDINCRVRYTFLNEDNSGYAGLANYYRERLMAEGVLAKQEETENIPFYYDIIAGVKETSHFLGVQYLHTFTMTSFKEAGEISTDLKDNGITNQVMNLQGWFNGGYYHDAPHNIRVYAKMGGKSGLETLNQTLAENGGTLYADVDFQEVTFADDYFNYNAEGSRYYGAGYVVALGQINPTTLYNSSGLSYMETKYDILSPKYLPRYVGSFAKKIQKYDVAGLSLRDMGDLLASDKRRTNVINREEALDVLLSQMDVLEATGKKLMTEKANSYVFAYSSDILNVPLTGNDFNIIDENIPLYEMIIHGSISYSSDLLNFEDEDHMQETILQMIEAGAAPHYVFTWEESSKMKDTGLSRYYATTYETWKDDAIAVYNKVNEPLKYVTGAVITNHEILANGVRKVTYDNGVVIYINYDEEDLTADGKTVAAQSYRLEGAE